MRRPIFFLLFSLVAGELDAQCGEPASGCVYSVRADTVFGGERWSYGMLPLEGGKVLMGTIGGSVHVVDFQAEGGVISDTTTLDEPVYGTPSLVTLGGERMIALPAYKTVYFFNLDGTKRSYPEPRPFSRQVAYDVISTTKGNLLVGSGLGVFWVVYEDGIYFPSFKVFTAESEETVFGVVPLLMKNARGEEVIVVGSTDGGVYLLDDDGNLIRRIETGSPVHTSAVLTPEGHFAVGLDDGRVVTFSLQGTKIAEFETRGATRGSDYEEWVTFEDGEQGFFETGVSTDPVFLPDGTMVVASEDGGVYFVDSATGTEKAFFQTRNQITSTPVVTKDSMVVVGSLDGKVYFFNPDGSLKAEFVVGDPVASDLGIMEIDGRESVLAAGWDGSLYRLELSTEPRDLAAAPVEVPDAPSDVTEEGLGTVVCVGSELETMASAGPVRRVIRKDVELVYRAAVELAGRDEVEGGLREELGQHAEVRCTWSEPGSSHVVVVSYTGVIPLDLTIDPDDPRFQGFSVGYGTDWDGAEADARADARFDTYYDGSGYEVIVREQWNSGGSGGTGDAGHADEHTVTLPVAGPEVSAHFR